MYRHVLALLLLPLLSSTGCVPAQAQRPVQFTVPLPAEDPFQILTRALVANGLTPIQGDPQAGVIQTRWENTGFGYGFVGGGTGAESQGANIWRRYAITLARQRDGLDILVRADIQRCAEGSSSLDGANILGNCTTAFTEGLVPDHQRALDDLGRRLRASLGASTAP